MATPCSVNLPEAIAKTPWGIIQPVKNDHAVRYPQYGSSITFYVFSDGIARIDFRHSLV